MKIRFAVAPGSPLLERAQLVRFADSLEASGFDGVWLSDLPVGGSLDPLLGLAAIAARTTRLRLGANVVPLGRRAFLLARDLAQLDAISDGRLLLSFVTGIGGRAERELLEIEDAGRGELLERTLGCVRSWWNGDAAAGHGVPATLTRPRQQPLEVWLGGRGPRTLERIGRIADGWLGALVTPAEAGAARGRIQAAAAAAGRRLDPEHFGLSIGYLRREGESAALERVRARRGDVDPRALVPAGAAALRELIGAHVEAGLSKFVLRPQAGGERWERELEWLADAVLDMQT